MGHHHDRSGADHAGGRAHGAERPSSRHLADDGLHDHRSLPSSSTVLVIAVALTSCVAIVEFIGGLWSGSLALLADCGHMATDSAALLISLAANKVAQRPVSGRHSYGLARAEVIAAFVNSLALLAVVVWLFLEGIQRILHPSLVNGGAVTAIAALGLGVNLAVAWLLSRDRANLNMRAALLHVLGDLFGSVAALTAGIVISLSGFLMIDPLLSILVSGLILRSTIAVLRESTLVLLDSVPSGVDFQNVGRALSCLDGVESIHDLHVWSMVPGKTAVSAHLLIEKFETWPKILHEARRALSSEFGIDHVTLQPEWLAPRKHGGTIVLHEMHTE
jgi:cobalt-zinc-cadmium efflux system protein